jgi:uncharacterized protein (TIGR00106 family)
MGLNRPISQVATAPEGRHLVGLNHFAIRVPNLDEAVRYYILRMKRASARWQMLFFICDRLIGMKVIADFCLIPIGIGVSVSKEIAACERVLKEAGLQTRLHAYGTNIEGEWDEVFAAIKRCHEVVHAMGTPRVSSTLRFGTRTDRSQTMDEKVRSVQQKLED